MEPKDKRQANGANYQMRDINILFGIPSPRDNIQEVIKAQYMKGWNCTRILPKFMTEYYAYKEIRDYFLENKEYTHLALAADDIVVEPRHIKFIQEDLQQYDFPVLSGVINVYQEDLMFGNVTPFENVPGVKQDDREIRWYRMDELRKMKEKIIPVGFAGFGLTVIRRDVVEQIEFDSDGQYNESETENSGSMDIVFCWRCKLHKIPIFCDTRIFMRHLRLMSKMRVGKEPAVLYYWPKDATEPGTMAMSSSELEGKICKSNYRV